jgi:hypothetical protein
VAEPQKGNADGVASWVALWITVGCDLFYIDIVDACFFVELTSGCVSQRFCSFDESTGECPLSGKGGVFTLDKQDVECIVVHA